MPVSMGACIKIWAATAVLMLTASFVLGRPSDPEATDEQRESRTSNGFKYITSPHQWAYLTSTFIPNYLHRGISPLLRHATTPPTLHLPFNSWFCHSSADRHPSLNFGLPLFKMSPPTSNLYMVFNGRAEHRSAPFDKDILNLRYYGGAEGNVLLYHPTLGLTPVQQQETVNKDDDENVGEEDGQGGGGSGGGSGNGEADDGVTIQLPPPGASVAEVRPVALSIAGIGGVAASKPTGTAVVGPGGLAIARPVATAIAGVPPDAVLGSGSQGPGRRAADTQNVKPVEEAYVAVGPHKQPGAKYGVVPFARNVPTHIPVYVRIQPHEMLSSVQYGHQPVLLYPVAYY